MFRPLLILVCTAAAIGCTSQQVKSTAAGISDVVARSVVQGLTEDDEVARGVERCKAQAGNLTNPNCSSTAVRDQLRRQQLAYQQERARMSRAASREQRKHFEETFDVQSVASGDVTVAEESQRQNDLLESLSKELSETLAVQEEPGK